MVSLLNGPEKKQVLNLNQASCKSIVLYLMLKGTVKEESLEYGQSKFIVEVASFLNAHKKDPNEFVPPNSQRATYIVDQ